MTTRLRARSFADGAITAAKIATDAVGPSQINLGANYAFTGTVTGAGSNILEMFGGICDGRSFTVTSGTYTFENVTALQNGTSSYVDLTGCTLSYKPPTGTTSVIYEFTYMFSMVDNGPLGHHKFFIDSVEVTNARWDSGSNTGYGMLQTFKWIINCNAASNVAADGAFTSWDALKELKIQVREYGSSNEAKWHTTNYWDGSSSAQFHRPLLTITAIK